jgi:hypothetical protein
MRFAFLMLLLCGCAGKQIDLTESDCEPAFDFSISDHAKSTGHYENDPMVYGSLQDDALCTEIVIVTYPPECPPCAMLESDQFEQDIAEAFGCVLSIDDNGMQPGGIPFAKITTLDGSVIECREFYDMSIETKQDRLRYVLACIAAAIEKYEVGK